MNNNSMVDGSDEESLSPENQRELVLRDLRHVLATARTKFDYRKRDSDKRAWARVIIGAAAAYGRIIDDNLERRVEALERDRVILKNEK